MKLLDSVWPVLRGQQVRTGHTVVVYYGGQKRKRPLSQPFEK